MQGAERAVNAAFPELLERRGLEGCSSASCVWAKINSFSLSCHKLLAEGQPEWTVRACGECPLTEGSRDMLRVAASQ